MEQQLLSIKETAKIIGVAQVTLWRMIRNDKEFPKPFKLTPKKTVFKATQITAWLNDLSQSKINTKTR